MRVRSNIRAGNDAQAMKECQQQRDYWKSQALRMEEIAKAPSIQPPATTPPTTTTGSGCGWVNGVYYADKSGLCG